MAPIKLTNKDIDLIVRLVATEADHKLAWSHPEDYTAQVHGIVDTVLNRVASGNWGDSVKSVANAKNQFSAINGPSGRGYDVYGSVDKVPDSAIPAFLPNIVNSWVTARRSGTPSSVGGNLNYANPKYSDAANQGWINALDGPKLGYGNSTHYHGTVDGLTPIEAQLAPLGGTEGLMAIQDKNAAARGYGELGPQPKTISPALQAARTRLATARQYQTMQASKATASGMAPASALQLGMSAGASKLSDPLRVGKAGLDITPRLPNDLANVTEAQRKALTANQPPLDVSPVQARAIAMDEGVGALGNPRSFSPGTLNPGPKFDPVGNGAAFADLNALKQGAPAPVPLPRDARPAAAVSAATETKTASVAPKMVKLDSGKMAKVGDTAVISGNVWTVQDNGDGTGKLIKAAPSILKEMNANTVAGGVVREKVGEAITAGKDAAVAAGKPVIDTVAKAGGDLIGQAGGFLGGLFGGATLGKPDTGAGIKLSVPITTAKPASVVPVSPPAGGGATLSAPGAGLSAAQRNAMSSLAGTGMANVMAPMPATMSPGVRTAALPATNPIVVSRPKASTPAASPAVGTPKLYQAGGYVYVANPSGSGYTKVGKVASYSGGSSSSGSSGSTIRSSTSSLRPGDRTYNADTNEWVVR